MTLTDMTNQEDQSTTTTITTVVESRVEKLLKSQIVSKTTTTETTEKITETFEIKNLNNELIPSSSTPSSSTSSSSSSPTFAVTELVESAEEKVNQNPPLHLPTIEIVKLDEENKSQMSSSTELAEKNINQIAAQLEIAELVEENLSPKQPTPEVVELDEENLSQNAPSIKIAELVEEYVNQIPTTAEITELTDENLSSKPHSIEIVELAEIPSAIEIVEFDDKYETEKFSLKYDQKLVVFNSEELEIFSSGYEALKNIADLFNGYVCLVGQNECEGKRLINVLNRSNVEFYYLEVNKPQAIAKFASYLKSTFNRVDVLINNFNLSFKSQTK